MPAGALFSNRTSFEVLKELKKHQLGIEEAVNRGAPVGHRTGCRQRGTSWEYNRVHTEGRRIGSDRGTTVGNRIGCIKRGPSGAYNLVQTEGNLFGI